MPYSRPALSDLISRTLNDVTSRLQNPNPLLRSDAVVYARALAGVAQGLYGYIDWLSKQLIYDTADLDYLIRWAGTWGLTQEPAAFATGTVALTGLSGADLPSGSVWTAFDNTLYTTTADAPIVGGVATVAVQAVLAGVAGNRAAGQTFTLQAAPGGINASGVASAMTGGAEIETPDSLRQRLLTRISQPPQGGDATDYVNWALSVPNVTRAWCFPLQFGVGTVGVAFMMDGIYSNSIPLAGDVTAVSNYIAARRPVTANVTTYAPIAAPINFRITGLSPSSDQATVMSEINTMLQQDAAPGGTILLSHIHDAIGVAAGAGDYTLVTPSANVTNSPGYISTAGTFTWT